MGANVNAVNFSVDPRPSSDAVGGAFGFRWFPRPPHDDSFTITVGEREITVVSWERG